MCSRAPRTYFPPSASYLLPPTFCFLSCVLSCPQDLQVALSAGLDAAQQIDAIALEVTGNGLRLPYRGAPRCEHVFSNMTRLGFAHSREGGTGPWAKDCYKNWHGDVLFSRAAASVPPPR